MKNSSILTSGIRIMKDVGVQTIMHQFDRDGDIFLREIT